MYTGSGFSDWEIGDITVIVHEGIYHLFHLIIPNHDYIAHAVSNDGLSWKRVKNALFVGDPGAWDDDMLWTMHVVKTGNIFEMYYTGLQRRDRGFISRVGLATSHNLFDWEKNTSTIFPVEPMGVFYETATSNPRTWLSFRDPFRIEYKNDAYLLLGARTVTGPVSRRGCVGVVKLGDYDAELKPALFCPMVYDDIECPCAFELNGKYYLIGSIREDIKVRYWFASDLFGEYHSFDTDVLLPQGNYAARTEWDGDHLLVYNFFYAGKIDTLRVLPPPKQLQTGPNGKLLLKSYYRWETMVMQSVMQQDFKVLPPLFSNPSATFDASDMHWICGTRSGYDLFCFEKPAANFIWEGLLSVTGTGKFGIVSDVDKDGYGYFIKLNITNGFVQIRSWGFNPLNAKQNFIFNDLQSGFFPPQQPDESVHFKLIRYGSYIELSINGNVILTLMDYTFSGEAMGIYTASSLVFLQNSQVRILPAPEEEYASQQEAQ